MIEVEIKLPVENPEAIEAKLIDLDFDCESVVREIDTYYILPDRNPMETDEAFRIRSIKVLSGDESESSCVMTYKGPKLDSVSMTRSELEVGLSDSETAMKLFEALHFVPVTPIVKTRHTLVRRDLTVCLDEVEGLGSFMELEILAPEEEQREAALSRMNGVLAALGLSMDDTIRRSYLSMLQESLCAAGDAKGKDAEMRDELSEAGAENAGDENTEAAVPAERGQADSPSLIYYLTSSPTGDLDGAYLPESGLDNRNGFLDRLRADWKENSRVLMITAAPAEHARNDEMRTYFREQTAKAGLSFSCFDLLDDREHLSRNAIARYDVIWLGGGHVPTQNAYFRRIGLKEKLAGFSGILIGISAGSMNAASLVYAQPEEPGEAADPFYHRFLPGLGVTEINLLPHYQLVKDKVLDGRLLIDEITVGDSYGQKYYVIPDGSYLRGDAQGETIYGECLMIEDGECMKVSEFDGKVDVS